MSKTGSLVQGSLDRILLSVLYYMIQEEEEEKTKNLRVRQ